MNNQEQTCKRASSKNCLAPVLFYGRRRVDPANFHHLVWSLCKIWSM